MADDHSVDLALARSEEDLRYPLGPLQPLDDLAKEFAHSPNHVRKVKELGSRGFRLIRRVRGDGNCFYRAVGFAWLEALVALAVAGRAAERALLCEWPDVAAFGHLGNEYRELRQAVGCLTGCHAASGASPTPVEVGSTLFARLLGDVRFDLCVVVLVRRIVADFLMAAAASASNASKLTTAVGFGAPEGQGRGNAVDDPGVEVFDSITELILEAVGGCNSAAHFARSDVLPLGQEAEGASIAIAARQLGTCMRIVQLDGSYGAIPDYVYPSEEYVSPLGVCICLLFRPGHYELLYDVDASRFSEVPWLHGRCSFCRERSELFCSGLLPCFHRLCRACSSQATQLNNLVQCPLCADFIPPQSSNFEQPPAAMTGYPKLNNPRASFDSVVSGQAPEPPKFQTMAHPSALRTDLPVTNMLSQAPEAPMSMQISNQNTFQTAPSVAAPPLRLRNGSGLATTIAEFPRSASLAQVSPGTGAMVSAASTQPLRPNVLSLKTASRGTMSGTGCEERRANASLQQHTGLLRTAENSISAISNGVYAPSVTGTCSRIRHEPATTDVPVSQPRITSTASPSRRQVVADRVRCLQCPSTENMRRVRCCGAHFCMACLSKMIGGRIHVNFLACVSCGETWDEYQLARCLNLVHLLPASPNDSSQAAAVPPSLPLSRAPVASTLTSAYMVRTGLGSSYHMASSPLQPSAPETGASCAGASACSSVSPLLPAPLAPSRADGVSMVTPSVNKVTSSILADGHVAPSSRPLSSSPLKGTHCAMCQAETQQLLPARCCAAYVCLSCDTLGGYPNCVCAPQRNGVLCTSGALSGGGGVAVGD